jgi:hypothetical protein
MILNKFQDPVLINSHDFQIFEKIKYLAIKITNSLNSLARSYMKKCWVLKVLEMTEIGASLVLKFFQSIRIVGTPILK